MCVRILFYAATPGSQCDHVQHSHMLKFKSLSLYPSSNVYVNVNLTLRSLFLFDPEFSKTGHVAAGDSLQQIKRAAQPLDRNFTWSGASDPLRKPIFKTMTPSSSDQSAEASDHCESSRHNRQSSPQQEVTDASGPQQETPGRAGEIKEEAASALMGCEPEAPSADRSDRAGEDEEVEEEEEDEDLTVFFTPELFEDDSEQGPESPLRAEGAAPQSEEALQVPGPVPASDGQTGVSVGEESAEQSREQRERQLEKQTEEGKEGQKSQPHSWFRRLSRSRQTVSSSSPPAGN